MSGMQEGRTTRSCAIEWRPAGPSKLHSTDIAWLAKRGPNPYWHNAVPWEITLSMRAAWHRKPRQPKVTSLIKRLIRATMHSLRRMQLQCKQRLQRYLRYESLRSSWTMKMYCSRTYRLGLVLLALRVSISVWKKRNDSYHCNQGDFKINTSTKCQGCKKARQQDLVRNCASFTRYSASFMRYNLQFVRNCAPFTRYSASFIRYNLPLVRNCASFARYSASFMCYSV